MKKLFFAFIFLFPLCINIFAQADSAIVRNDSVQYTNNFVFKEGVYLDYKDLLANNPLPKEKIVAAGDKTQLDFISKTLSDNNEIIFSYKGAQYKADVKKIWGYCQNNAIYIGKEGKFYRIPVFGNISHFFATVEVVTYMNNYGYGGFGFGYGGMMGPATPVKQKETRQFVMDYKTGDVFEASLPTVESLLSRDMELYTQYMKLKKKQRRELMILYIRRFNEAHPVFFPLN